MGYAVYEDIWHPGRWAGYGVPAECDFPDCDKRIDRGLGYQCDKHYSIEDVYIGDEWDHEEEHVLEGCYLYFCSEHCYQTDKHHSAEPKPDSPEWAWWVLVSPSWQKWRDENPARALAYLDLLGSSSWRPNKFNYEELFMEIQDAG